MRKWLSVVGLLVAVTSVAVAEWVGITGAEERLSVTVVESSDARIVLDYEISGFEKDPVTIGGDTYYLISLGKESKSLEAGLPELPNVRRSLVIPDDARMIVNVIESEYVDIPTLPVAPSKGNLLRTVNPADVPYTFDAFYGTDGWYPENLVGAEDPYILRDLRGILVQVNPLQYNPSTATLRVYTKVRVEVVNAGPGVVNVLQTPSLGKRIVGDFLQIYSEHFVNFDRARYASIEEVGNMLIITYDSFHADVQPLADWKNQMGVPCEIVDMSVAGSTANEIKAFIQNYYDTQGVTFILLVGDAPQLPPLYSGGGASDPSFALLAGGDNYPDAFVGRFSAENPSQLQTQVERSIGYESNPMAGADWYHKGTGIASNQGPGDDGEYDNQHQDVIRQKLLNYGYTEVDQIYDPYGTAAMVSAALNNGRSTVNYTGHGSVTSWGSTGFSNSHVNALVNDWMLPFITSVACVNGDFDGTTCFAEAWLRATNNGVPTGAIGTYMSSVNQSWNPPMCAQDEVIDLLVQDEKRTYGALCFNGSCQMMDEYGYQGVSEFKAWHVFGDPSLRVRTNTPATMTVVHSDVIAPDATEFEVTISEGLSEALCGLSYEGTFLGSAFTDETGHAMITVVGELPVDADVTLTVTAYNHIPYVAGVHVGELALPAIVVDPMEFVVELEVGEVTSEILTISNVGEPGSMLTFDVTVDSDGPPWCRVLPRSGELLAGESAELEVRISAVLLFPGVYYCTLMVDNNAGPTIEVPVFLSVGGAQIGVEGNRFIPSALVLERNSPNPFNPSTSIGFGLPEAGWVRLHVFDVNGRRVAALADGPYSAGMHELRWDGRADDGAELGSGVYYYRIEAAGKTETKRMVMLK